MQGGERDLGGADQVELVLGQAVDLLLGVGQHAGAVERLLAHEHRRDHRLEALAAQALERLAHERELEQHEVALAGRRSASPTGARRASMSISAPASSRWSAAGPARAARRPSRSTVSSIGGVGRRQVRQRRAAPACSCASAVRELPRQLASRARRSAAHASCSRSLGRRPALGGAIASEACSARRAAPRARGSSGAPAASSSSTASTPRRRRSPAARQRRPDRVRLVGSA